MKHAKLGASSSARWLNCPASVRMCEGLKNESSHFAAEGTAAHDLAERCLTDGNHDASHYIGEVINGFTVDSTMADYVQRYVNYVDELSCAEQSVEQRVQYTDWVPEGFGTADYIGVTGSHVDVVDLKYGKGVEVSAENNTQGMLYALGVFQAYDYIYNFETVSIHIVQPRIGNYSEWSISREDLLKFGEYVKERSALCLTDDAPFGPSEKACRWCLAQSTCKALADHNLKLIGAEFDDLTDLEPESPEKLAAEQVAKLIEATPLLTGWLKSIGEHALDACLNGESIPGYKVVEGRSNRKWGEDLEDLHLHLTEDQLYTKKLITPTQAEKLVGKGVLDEFIVKPEGKPTLAPVSDKRKPLLKVVDSFEDLT